MAKTERPATLSARTANPRKPQRPPRLAHLPPDSIFLTIREAAPLCRKSPNRLYQLAADRDRTGFPAVRDGKVWLVNRARLVEWAATRGDLE